LTFEKLKLISPLLKALELEGYKTPTPIQEQSIPIILEKKDILGCAQTGTGKTAAFALPILQIFHDQKENDRNKKDLSFVINKPRQIKALILTPTRELAIQINDSFQTYGKFTGLKTLVIFGGVSQKNQVIALKSGIDILIATPGRLIDLMNQNFITLNHLQIFVLDEADRMLDMGFIHDIKKIKAKLPQKRQTLFFSATMPPEISELAGQFLSHPERVSVTPVSSTSEKIDQTLYFVSKSEKKQLLIHLLNDKSIDSALVFTRTKHGANKIAQDITKAGISADAIHGNKSQNARQRALADLKDRKIRVLVATDIAARGIDVDELSHVINYDLPEVAETYIHRIGRTGRAGLSGKAISFCDEDDRMYLRDINKLTLGKIKIIEKLPFTSVTKIDNRLMTVTNLRVNADRKENSFNKKVINNNRNKYGNKKRIYAKSSQKKFVPSV
jgi:ATP-dependent RNA helicase RhlE